MKAKNIDGDDAKALITEYYKEINKRDDNEKAMVEKTEKKAKTKRSEEKTK